MLAGLAGPPDGWRTSSPVRTDGGQDRPPRPRGSFSSELTTRERAVAEDPEARGPEEEAAHRRGLKFRRRDDYAINLFREAKANLADVHRVDRILLELGRFYDPLAGGAIVDLATRIRIVEALRAGRTEDAVRLLDERLALYTKFEGEGRSQD